MRRSTAVPPPPATRRSAPKGHLESRRRAQAFPSVSQVPMQVVLLEDLQGTVDALVAKAMDKGSPSNLPAGDESPGPI